MSNQAIPKLDLESYIQNYSGRTRCERLYHIGTNSSHLAVEALKAAVNESKQGPDCVRYQNAVEALQKVAPHESEAQLDTQWIDRLLRRNAAETERLEGELKTYKNNLIKESIRMGNEDLGKHYHAIGDLENAYQAFGRMRQDVTAQKHIADVGKHLIHVCLDQHNWVLVHSNTQKLSAVKGMSPEEHKLLQPYQKVPAGIALMSTGRYLEAANHFITTEAGLDASFNHIASPNDVAVYGGICALATMDRSQLQRKVLESSNFRTYLELEPHIRRAISFFINGRYAACLSILESYRTDYQLDIYLSPHISELYYLIRSKSIIQYFIPFSCVTIQSLQEAFGTPGIDIEQELIRMIRSKALVARIDMQSKLLVSVPDQPRQHLQATTIAAAVAYEKEMRRRLLRMNILGAGLEVKSNKSSGGMGGAPTWGNGLSGIAGGDDSGYD